MIYTVFMCEMSVIERIISIGPGDCEDMIFNKFDSIRGLVALNLDILVGLGTY
jgi:hypothetical protein